METEKQFIESLEISKFMLKLGGLNLRYGREKTMLQHLKHHWFYYITMIVVYSAIVGETTWLILGFMEGKKITELTFIGSCTMYGLLGVVKIMILFPHRHTVLMLMEKLTDWQKKESEKLLNNDDDRVRIVKDCMKFMNFIVKTLYYMNVVLGICFCMSPIILMAVKYFRTGVNEWMLPFLIKYPFNPFTIFVWPFAYVHQCWAALIAVVTLVGADTFFYICCSQMRMHFEILKYNLENFTKINETAQRQCFARLIVRHQELIEFVSQLEYIYTKSTLFNFVTSSMLICLNGLHVTAIESVSQMVTFAFFLATSLAQIFLICFFGDMIMKSSASVSDGLYNSHWYKPNVCMKKEILFVITRAQQPCKLTAVKFTDVNLRAFTRILSTAWSYFALLRTMYEPKHEN